MITLLFILTAILIVSMVLATIAAAIGIVVLPIIDVVVGIAVVMLLFKFIGWLKSLGSKDKKEES